MKEKYNHLIDNVWGADVADTQLITKFNEGIRFLSCVTDIHSKYVRVIPLEDKKKFQLLMLFKKV